MLFEKLICWSQNNVLCKFCSLCTPNWYFSLMIPHSGVDLTTLDCYSLNVMLPLMQWICRRFIMIIMLLLLQVSWWIRILCRPLSIKEARALQNAVYYAVFLYISFLYHFYFTTNTKRGLHETEKHKQKKQEFISTWLYNANHLAR